MGRSWASGNPFGSGRDGEELHGVGDNDAGCTRVAHNNSGFLGGEIELTEADPESVDGWGLGEVDPDGLWTLGGVEGNGCAFFGSSHVRVGVADLVLASFGEEGAIAEGFFCLAVAHVAAERLTDKASVVPAHPIVGEGDVEVVDDDARQCCGCDGLGLGPVGFEVEDLVLFGELVA